MEKLFATVIDMSIGGCWVILAVLLARLLLKKVPAVVRFGLWALVALRLLVPMSLESDLSLVPQPEPPAVTQQRLEQFAEAPLTYQEPELSVPVDGETGPEATFEAPQEQSFRLTPAHIWLAGVAAMALWAFAGWLRLRLRVRTAVRLRENVYLCDHIPSPFVLGLFQPRIYLPSELPQEQMDYVLAHERGHIFRWDHATRLLAWGVLAVHWFSPLVWLSFILFCRDMEMACDEWVIRGLERAEVRRYSEALIACSLPRGRLGVSHLAFGEVGIKARIRNILHYKKPTLWIALAAAATVLVVTVCFLTEPAPEDGPIVQTEPAGERIEAQTQPTAAGFAAPLELLSSLEPEGARATADFRDGTGYGFFPYEAEELVSLLNALTEEDFIYDPEVAAVMEVTVTTSSGTLTMETDTDLVVFSHEGERWGIRDEDLSYFFRILYTVTDYEEQDVAPLGELRESYNMEEAMIDLCVIQEDGQLRYNADVWDAFISSCKAGNAATVRIWERTDGVTCVQDLSFDGSEYCLYWYEDDELCTERWIYLHHFSGTEGQYGYDHFILTDDPGCTWDESTHTLHHSQGHQGGNGHHGSHHGAAQTYSGHHQICSRYTYHPKHPALPGTLDKVELVLDGKVLLATVVPESLARLEAFFENAEETYEPKTYSLGPELVLWFREETVRVQLELNSDLCVIDGVFYDYGPGYTDDGSYNALKEMLACFGIQSWPQPVLDKYGDYIWS